ncbi:MAG: hypothetical protein PHG00_14175 [Methylococcales bacterium]|nr:hypothetical protein [Methylococcales bacterium]
MYSKVGFNSIRIYWDWYKLDQDGKFHVSLYKALFFVEITEGMKSGALNLLHSEKYRSLDEYMIQKADWEANQASYL